MYHQSNNEKKRRNHIGRSSSSISSSPPSSSSVPSISYQQTPWYVTKSLPEDCDPTVFKWLLQQGFDTRDCQKAKLFDFYGRHLTPMARASECGELKVCEALFKTTASADVTLADTKGFTPMIFAAMNGHLHICQWLYYKAGVSPDVADHHLQTPLHWACARGNLDVVQWLFSVLPTTFDNLDIISLLMASNTSNKMKMNNGDDDDGSNNTEDYRTILRPTKALQRPLYLACANGHVDVARFLITQGGVHKPVESNQPPSSLSSNDVTSNQIVWKLDQSLIMKDINMSLAEPYLYTWCYNLIDSNVAFMLFLMACHFEGHSNKKSLSSSLPGISLCSFDGGSPSNSLDNGGGGSLSTRSSKRQCITKSKSGFQTDHDSSSSSKPCWLIKLKKLDKSYFLHILEYAGIPKGAALKDFKELLGYIQFD